MQSGEFQMHLLHYTGKVLKERREKKFEEKKKG